MRLNSITATRHVFDGQVIGKPLRLRLNFDGMKALCLQPAGNGEEMIADDGTLDVPLDLGEYGQTDTADLTESMFPNLQDLDVTGIEALTLNGRCVGVKLSFGASPAFHFWVDGDEIYWGDDAALINHDWLDGAGPTTSGLIEP